MLFRSQVMTLLKPGDILIMISASGNSLNLLDAAGYCRENSIYTVSITGFNGGKLAEMSDLNINIQTKMGAYGAAEDSHIVFNHLLASAIRFKLYGANPE